jgi:hypothetical protein
MSMRGRHVSSRSPAFARDLLVMLVGIFIVGVVVFGGLYVFTRLGDDGGGTAAPPSSTTTASTEVAGTVVSTTSTTVATSTTTLPSTTSAIVVREPAEVRVLVLNAVGRSGIAATLTQQLADRGYQTLEPDNYQPPLEQSRVWYRPGYGAEALEVAAFVPDALIELNPDEQTEADVVVVLGASFAG